MNAYDMLADLRSNLNEATADHWTDTELLRKLNQAQQKTAMHLSMQPGNWLIASAAVSPSGSVITLPSDCAKPLYIEETSSGTPILFKTSLQDRRTSRSYGVEVPWDHRPLEAYPLMNTIEVNQDSYSTACTLWYQIRVPDLHTGTASAGGAASLTMDTTDGTDGTGNGARLEADYYNNVDIEIVSGTGPGIDTVTDYSVARVCTVTGTYSTDSVYGTVPRGIPDQGHGLIILEATMLALSKPSASIDPTVKQDFREEKREMWKTFKDWTGSRIPGAGRHTRITELDI